MNRGHTPVRMCIICRERFPKSDITRYTLPAEGGMPEPDPAQKKPGRGMYVCSSPECQSKFMAAARKRRKRKEV